MNPLAFALLLAVPGPLADDSQPPPLLAAPTPALPPEPRSREVYELHLAVDIPVTVVAGSAALVRVLFEDDLVRKKCPCDPSGINALDRGTVGNHSAAASVAANVTVYGVMAALPLADLVDLGFSRAWAQDLGVYAETLAIDTALQNAANFIVNRPRPLTYAGDPQYLHSGEGYVSFYAGHVATAFASLSMAAFTINRRYGEQVWPWIVAGLIGSSVAVERVASGHHFPTDVAVAAVAGSAIGITVPWLHLRPGRSPVSIVPTAGGLGLAGRF
jgi:membrane-associated phospholipid phosphatase